MKQITKITFTLAILFSLASCQSAKTGCYDFGSIDTNTIRKEQTKKKTTVDFTNAVCKP